MYEDPLFEQPGVVPLSFVKRVRKASRTEKERAARSLLDSRVYQKWEYEMLKHAHREASSAHTDCEGDEMVKRVSEAMKILDENGFERSSHQRLFHRSFMMASLEQFYREDLQRNLVRLLREYGASELHSEVAIMTPRRFGKTWGVAMWAACMLVTGRDHDTCIYSTGARVSKMMLQTILRMVRVLMEHFGGGIISINKNEEVVFQTNEGYINSICAYPAKSETLRGTGSKRRTGTVILEEAAFIDPAVSLSIVAPTLTRKYVNLFAISTINSEDMVMSSFMTAKYPDGRSVMLSLNFSLVCEACRDAGKADSCQHRMGDLPHWSSVAQHQKLHALMSQAQETLNREIRGIDVSENTKPAFNSGALTALADAELGTVQKLPPQTHVFIVVDPACGGSNSSLALISFVVTGNKVVVSNCVSCSSPARQFLALRVSTAAQSYWRARNAPTQQYACGQYAVESSARRWPADTTRMRTCEPGAAAALQRAAHCNTRRKPCAVHPSSAKTRTKTNKQSACRRRRELRQAAVVA